MDFRQSAQPSNRPASAPVSSVSPEKDNSKVNHDSGRVKLFRSGWLDVLNVVVLFGVAALVVAIAFVFTRSGGDNEYKYVNANKYQAVFLNNGQVYFGNITQLNNKFVQLNDIYYLTQSTTATDAKAATEANSSYTLVKLGCQQIHDPVDQMLINRDQVTFWENLQDGGKVVKSIQEFVKQNPKGPDCTQVSTQTQATSNASAQGSSTTPAATTKP